MENGIWKGMETVRDLTVSVTGANLTGKTINVLVDGAAAAAAHVNNATSAAAAVYLPQNTAASAINHNCFTDCLS